mmetsp:Transcript_62382/g.103762  ORF Transcript_62382/g.103762 Transcript_62382/m.103762 type:complete len:337 (+) Transcript_62382:85-1095(+)
MRASIIFAVRTARITLNHPVIRSAVGCSLAAFAVPHRTTHSLAGPAPVPRQVKLGLCQIHVVDNKAENLKVAETAVREAVQEGAKIVSLPEIFNGPYAVNKFGPYAEEIPESAASIDGKSSPSIALMSSLAKELRIYLIGGSIAEKDAQGKLYNTAVVFGPDGTILTKHRKMHLFDIDIPGKITFKESETLTSGNAPTLFDTPYGRIGVGICYDIRFPQLASLYRDAGACLIVYPGCFNLTTGPAHWELLQRGRAVDNQLFVATVSQARNPDAGYQSWGHSTIVSPWGTVLATTDHMSGNVYAELDLSEVEQIRKQVPVSFQKREDLYTTVKLRKK